MKKPQSAAASPPESAPEPKLETPAAKEAKVAPNAPGVQEFVEYGKTIAANESLSSDFKSAVGDLIAEYVEKDRLGEKPDADVLRKHIRAAAKAENMPDVPVVPIP